MVVFVLSLLIARVYKSLEAFTGRNFAKDRRCPSMFKRIICHLPVFELKKCFRLKWRRRPRTSLMVTSHPSQSRDHTDV
jgi:hypothetical protein